MPQKYLVQCVLFYSFLCDDIWTSLFVCFSVAGITTGAWPGLCAMFVKLRVLQLCSPASWRLSSGMFLSLRSTSCSTARPRPCCLKVRSHSVRILKLTGYNGLKCLVLFILSVTVITFLYLTAQPNVLKKMKVKKRVANVWDRVIKSILKASGTTYMGTGVNFFSLLQWRKGCWYIYRANTKLIKFLGV